VIPVSAGLQIVGALAVLAGFLGAQLKLLTVTSFLYLALNLAGSATLAILAASGSQWGFLLLEGAWSVVSLAGIIKYWSRHDRITGEPRTTSRAGRLDRH
jgi:hypothetical protein